MIVLVIFLICIRFFPVLIDGLVNNLLSLVVVELVRFIVYFNRFKGLEGDFGDDIILA